MTRQMSPQEQARLDSIKRSWQQKREITSKLDRIKNKIGVYSGKGGVGKTTVAVNLAVTLAQKGYTVGLMDTDIDCPNATRVLGVYDKPTFQDGLIIPPEKYGVKILSMAFFQENEEEAIIWRGPMVMGVVRQFLQDVDWGELDVLVVDGRAHQAPGGAAFAQDGGGGSVAIDFEAIQDIANDLSVTIGVGNVRPLEPLLPGMSPCHRPAECPRYRHIDEIALASDKAES